MNGRPYVAACPLVAGAVALYLEKFPTATVEDVARAVAATTTPVTTGGADNGGGGSVGGGGGGMLNLPAMLGVQPKEGARQSSAKKMTPQWMPRTMVHHQTPAP